MGERPLSQEELREHLVALIDGRKDALSTLTTKTALREVEQRAELDEGAISAKESPHRQWAQEILLSILSEKLDKDPGIVNPQAGGSKATKEKKEPAPKKPPTACALYVASVKDKVKADNPDKKGRELTKIAEQMWEKLSDSEKQPFVDKADEKKKQAGSTTKASAKQKDDDAPETDAPAGPKKNKASFMFFMARNRAKIAEELKDQSGKNVSVVAGERWKAMDDNNPEKKKCIELAEEDKKRYQAELEQYKKDHGTPPKKERKKRGAAEADEKPKKRKKDPGAPKKAKTAVDYYIADHKEDAMKALGLQKYDMIKCRQHLQGKFKELGDDSAEKKKYLEMAEKDKQRYERQRKEFKATGSYAEAVKDDDADEESDDE